MRGFIVVHVLMFLLWAPSSAPAVERESAAETDEEKLEKANPRTGLGFESESKLKTESAGKSYFFLSNEVPWPERQELAPLPPRAAAPSTPPKPPKPPRSQKLEEAEDDARAAESPAVRDTSAVAAATARDASKRSRKAESANAATQEQPKKSKPARKPSVALPDIEQLLADVRRSAQPKLTGEFSAVGQRPSDAASAPVSGPPIGSEVVQSVDMDALIHDLEKLQKGAAAPRDNPAETKTSGSPAWWTIFAAVAGVAGAAFTAMWIMRRRKQPPHRSQSQIDSETRAFFAKLMKEQKRRPAPPARSTSPQAPPAAPEMDEARAAGEFAAAMESADARDDREPREPAVFLLPPELAEEGAYKEVVKMAAMGETPHLISEKLNLGEGEVRLVLDIARLSRGRLQTAS